MRKETIIRYAGMTFSHRQIWRLIEALTTIDGAVVRLHARINSMGWCEYRAEIEMWYKDGTGRAMGEWDTSPFRSLSGAVAQLPHGSG